MIKVVLSPNSYGNIVSQSPLNTLRTTFMTEALLLVLDVRHLNRLVLLNERLTQHTALPPLAMCFVTKATPTTLSIAGTV